MKTQETLFASFVIASITGVGASLAARAFVDHPARPAEPRGVARESAPPNDDAPSAEVLRTLDDLRMGNATLTERISTLEGRLAEVLTQRTPVEAAPVSIATETRIPDTARAVMARANDGIEVTPSFVESVGQALDKIKAREEAERQAKRKELQALRIEERLTRLQEDLGLSNRQVSDMRTVLLGQEEKRDALTATVREGDGDRRTAFEGFRALREETFASLQTILTPQQLESFKSSEETDSRRRGPGDFGGPGGPPRGPDGLGFGGREGR